ncbi:MAG: hypothetical protein A3K25_10070 [Planctomycetes bacterium RIFOXYB12_FULL_42_10]|nr:MAG: hypothetical protein A3K25_10070 [Planctomycetes bacterium RIFOXYB12_FULL_42_10]
MHLFIKKNLAILKKTNTLTLTLEDVSRETSLPQKSRLDTSIPIMEIQLKTNHKRSNRHV